MENFKLGFYPDIKNKEMLDLVNDGKGHDVLLSTNRLNIEFDNRDQRLVKTIKEVKLIYELEGKGCLILLGNLGCDFRQPMGGMFFCKRVYVDQNVDYHAIKGVEMNICFSNYPLGIESTQSILARLVADENFEFNLSQFDEFMDIFTFYKKLSSELNNNTTFSIRSISDPYYYVPVDVKDIDIDEANQITNLNGIVTGYKIERYKYDMLSSENQDKVRKLVDIKIEVGEEDGDADRAIKKVKKFAHNLYLTPTKEIDENMTRNLVGFDLVNIQKDK